MLYIYPSYIIFNSSCERNCKSKIYALVDTVITGATQSGDKTEATVRFTEFASRSRDATAATSVGRLLKDRGAGSVARRGIIGARGTKIRLHSNEYLQSTTVIGFTCPTVV